MVSYGGPYDGRMTRISRDGYPEQVCIECGCSVIGATEIVQHNEFHNNYVRRDTSMGTAAWCDPGSHAYKAGEPGSQSGQMTVTDDDGRPQTVRFDACRQHSFPTGTPAPAPEIANPDTLR